MSYASWVLSWAPPGQFGSGHVNPRSLADVQHKLGAFGLHVDLQLSALLANHATFSWFRKNLMVFRRAHTRWHDADGLPESHLLHRMRTRYCGTTSFQPMHACSEGKIRMGSIAMRPGKTGPVAGIAGCLEYCRQYAYCNYVSASAAFDDCSWFADCAFDRLLQEIPDAPAGSGGTVVTLRVDR